MAILARFLAFSLLATLASTLDQYGLFGCPDFTKQAVGIPYGNTTALNTYGSKLSPRFPLKLIAAGESEEAAQYSCISIDKLGADAKVSYYKNMTSGNTGFAFNTTTFQYSAKLPKGLLGVPDNTTARTWTIVSDKDGVVVMKTCKGAFLSHYTSTYVFVDKTVDTSSLDMKCLIPAIDKSLSVSSKQKGIC